MNTTIHGGPSHGHVRSPVARGRKRLDFLAARTGRSKAFYLREMIERGLDDMEDYYLAADVLERLRKGEEQVLVLRIGHRREVCR